MLPERMMENDRVRSATATQHERKVAVSATAAANRDKVAATAEGTAHDNTAMAQAQAQEEPPSRKAAQPASRSCESVGSGN